MNPSSKRRGWPVPDATNLNIKPIAFKLEETLAVENQYKPYFSKFKKDRKPWEVTLAGRDDAVQTLRFLCAFYDMPQSVFFNSTAFLDNFLSLVKVQEKFFNCVIISCLKNAAKLDNITIDIPAMLKLTETKCSVKDVERMSKIILEKVIIPSDLPLVEETPNEKITKRQNVITTGIDFLNIFLDILDCLINQLMLDSDMFKVFLNRERLIKRLEYVMAHSKCSFNRPSTISLALLQYEVNQFMPTKISEQSAFYLGESVHLLRLIKDLQILCKIPTTEFIKCSDNVCKVLATYDSCEKITIPLKTSMKFSRSTYMLAKRRKFSTRLTPIQEKRI